MTNERVTGFAVQSDGSRSFTVTVNGLRVLVTAAKGDHEEGTALAVEISTLGPEFKPKLELSPRPTPQDPVAPAKKRDFVVGQKVWCNVSAVRAYCTVTEVGAGRNKGRIKISGERGWCPVHNFDERGREGAKDW